jgi:hypothetical protein
VLRRRSRCNHEQAKSVGASAVAEAAPGHPQGLTKSHHSLPEIIGLSSRKLCFAYRPYVECDRKLIKRAPASPSVRSDSPESFLVFRSHPFLISTNTSVENESPGRSVNHSVLSHWSCYVPYSTMDVITAKRGIFQSSVVARHQHKQSQIAKGSVPGTTYRYVLRAATKKLEISFPKVWIWISTSAHQHISTRRHALLSKRKTK